MKEPIIVSHAQHAPNKCAICPNTTGPFTDTFFEDVLGRKYLCKRCAQTNARIFGFADGKRLQELSEAAALVEGKDLEIVKLHALIEELRLDAGASRRLVKELQEQVQAGRDVLHATRHMAAQMEQAAHELVECVAPAAPVEVAA